MRFATRIFFLLGLASIVNAHGFFPKKISDNSKAGNAIRAMNAFWLKKLSDDVKKECIEQRMCEALATHMSHVVALVLKRPDAPQAAEAVKRIEKDDATPQDILLACQMLEVYGEATIEKDALKVLDNEPTNGPFSSSFFRSELKEATVLIETMGKKAHWSAEKIEQEKEHITKILEEFLVKRKNKK